LHHHNAPAAAKEATLQTHAQVNALQQHLIEVSLCFTTAPFTTSMQAALFNPL
jgi:hypothetical protein